MGYKYESFDRTITVREGQLGHTDQRLVGVTVKDQSVCATIFVKPEDAPAIALAILQASGINPSDDPKRIGDGVHEAVHALNWHVRERADRAAREAEDAKVVEFHTAIGANLNRIERHHRDLYNAARKFFEES